MQLLQHCCPINNDIETMLKLAYTLAKEKVILKRPIKSELNSSMQAHYIISGSKIAFNIFKKNQA